MNYLFLKLVLYKIDVFTSSICNYVFIVFYRYTPDAASEGGATTEPIDLWEDRYDFAQHRQSNDPKMKLPAPSHMQGLPDEELESNMKGNIRVWTLEICEAGFSIFGTESLKGKMMRAIVGAAIKDGK